MEARTRKSAVADLRIIIADLGQTRDRSRRNPGEAARITRYALHPGYSACFWAASLTPRAPQ
jgi:hypothetical protein